MAQTVYVARKGKSRMRMAARKLGIIIDAPQPKLPQAEQEETDIM